MRPVLPLSNIFPLKAPAREGGHPYAVLWGRFMEPSTAMPRHRQCHVTGHAQTATSQASRAETCSTRRHLAPRLAATRRHLAPRPRSGSCHATSQAMPRHKPCPNHLPPCHVTGYLVPRPAGVYLGADSCCLLASETQSLRSGIHFVIGRQSCVSRLPLSAKGTTFAGR